jgi:ketosteroid isomerase-like protein
MRGSDSAPAAVAIRFNDAITRRDLDGLTALMSPDPTFTDTAGHTVSGREACREAWLGFFASFPDYRNVVATVDTHDDLVVITGHSVCSEPALAGPAIWTATVRSNRVDAWSVHDDTPDRRRILGLPGSP